MQRFREMVASRDKRAFLKEFEASAEHFGEDNRQEAFILFDNLSRLMTDLSEDNSVILQVAEDRPGILHQISGILAEAGINLTSFHSFRAGEGYRFWVGLDRPRRSPEVQAALTRINKETSARVETTS
jgi:prephenate dehydratase